MRRRIVSRWAYVLGILCILWLLLGFVSGCSTATESPQAEEKRVPTAEADPNVSLDVSVGLISGRILITNRSMETLRNILVVLNEGNQEAEFRHTIGIVQPQAMMHFIPRVFKKDDGTAFDPAVHQVKSFTVYADISSGRGRWTGSY